jgi:hypothetical protein
VGFASEAVGGAVESDVLRLSDEVLPQLLEDVALGPLCFEVSC